MTFVRVMNQNWIFLVTEYSDYNPGTSDKIKKWIVEERIWRVGNKTRNRRRVTQGDNVLFYLTGIGNQCFIARAKTVSGFQDIGNSIWGVVGLNEIYPFSSPIYIHSLISKLDFLKNKDSWWCHLQGGITSITSDDFKLISGKGKPM